MLTKIYVHISQRPEILFNLLEQNHNRLIQSPSDLDMLHFIEK